jgi:hypothetical protein
VGETLRTLVQRLADEPTPANRDAFYRALVTAQVAVPLRAVPTGLRPGDAVADGQLSVPTTSGPDGSVMLLVYTDQEAAIQSPQARAGFSLAGRVVLEMAAANRAGVIVATGSGMVPLRRGRASRRSTWRRF